MKTFLIIFNDNTFKLDFDHKDRVEVSLDNSYLDDCGNYLLDSNVLDIVEIDDPDIYIPIYKDCDKYKESLCTFLGMQAPSIFTVCNGKKCPECYFCPCYNN